MNRNTSLILLGIAISGVFLLVLLVRHGMKSDSMPPEVPPRQAPVEPKRDPTLGPKAGRPVSDAVAPAVPPIQQSSGLAGDDVALSPPPGTPGARMIYAMGSVPPPKLLRSDPAVYPPAAMENKLEGKVTLEEIIDEHGNIEATRILQSSNPVFNQAALDAVRNYQYEPPTTADGQAVPIFNVVTVEFALPR